MPKGAGKFSEHFVIVENSCYFSTLDKQWTSFKLKDESKRLQ